MIFKIDFAAIFICGLKFGPGFNVCS